ncbi:NAD(P)H-binding protein [Actinorhabdospora filicis]|nr:NAD(P)H-binding protein [Actinorhabdospora filicis]
MILVTGATGHVGGALLRHLSVPARMLTRDAARALPGVEVAVGDLADPASLAPAFAGVEKLFLMDPVFSPDGTRNAVHAAKEAGVKHIVLLSSIGVTLDPLPLLGAEHAEREAIVRDSGIAWTLLRPSHFATNTARWIGELEAGRPVVHADGDARYPTIDPADIGEVAALVLGGGHEGRAYVLTGEEPLSVAEQAAVLAARLGVEARVTGVAPEQAERGMLASGMPPKLAAAIRDLHEATRAGRTGVVTPTVRELLGRAPRGYADWVGAL